MLCDEKPRERYKKKGYIDIRENMNNKSKSNLEVSCTHNCWPKFMRLKKFGTTSVLDRVRIENSPISPFKLLINGYFFVAYFNLTIHV